MVTRFGLGNRERQSILTVASLIVVAIVALAAYSRQNTQTVTAGDDSVRAGNSIPVVQLVDEVEESNGPEATPAPAALRSKPGAAAQFETVPPPTTEPPPRPRPAPTATTTTTEPETKPTPSTEPVPSTDPPDTPSTPPIPPTITLPPETTIIEPQPTTTRFWLPPILTWLTLPPPTVTPPETVPPETVPPETLPPETVVVETTTNDG